MDQQALDQSGLGLVRLVSRHLGCLVVNYQCMENGTATGIERAASFSGFFVEILDRWSFATAGHVFHDADVGLETLRLANRIQITGVRIFDGFGSDAIVPHPTLMTPDDLQGYSIDEGTRGLDFALIPLRDLYVDSFRANGIAPFQPRHWTGEVDGTRFAVALLGFPEEDKVYPTAGDDFDGSVRASLVWVLPCDLPPGSPVREYPMFTGRIPTERPASPVGLSGGPVLEFYRLKDGQVMYRLLGLQSIWWTHSRIVHVCTMSAVVRHLREQLDELAANLGDAT
ncbi:hypothetical protein [Gemmata sp.]|uniref:hypothetical protein n=1 Tax=Gemmata sp. TaxID=1914242 RepID=UPI003F6E56AB